MQMYDLFHKHEELAQFLFSQFVIVFKDEDNFLVKRFPWVSLQHATNCSRNFCFCMNPGISEIIPFAPQWTFSKQDFQQSLTILFFSKGLCSLFRVQVGRNYSTFLTSSLHIKDMLYHHYPTKGSFLICCSMQEVKNKLAAFCKPTLLRIDKGES